MSTACGRLQGGSAHVDAWGEGVKKPDLFVDVINGWPLKALCPPANNKTNFSLIIVVWCPVARRGSWMPGAKYLPFYKIFCLSLYNFWWPFSTHLHKNWMPGVIAPPLNATAGVRLLPGAGKLSIVRSNECKYWLLGMNLPLLFWHSLMKNVQ